MVKIVFTEPAECDLLDIEYHIHIILHNPQAAERVTEGILDEIEKLSIYPALHPFVNDELLKSVGLRMTRFDNYNIFYYYDSVEETVYIIRVMYTKADWQSILKK